ncbi:MAG: hypothetical protein QGI51_01820 [Dehalococcoidales bacterium]|jgi:hypothetical protein|nr:hypothetical protein [Dehalococcoidales bacterium]MDP6824566.1 hypothetical protein [Dehalococcoidales bacterium]
MRRISDPQPCTDDFGSQEGVDGYLFHQGTHTASLEVTRESSYRSPFLVLSNALPEQVKHINVDGKAKPAIRMESGLVSPLPSHAAWTASRPATKSAFRLGRPP